MHWRLPILAFLLLVAPLCGHHAEDQSESKPPTRDDKKVESKAPAKSPPANASKYESIGKIAGKVLKIDQVEMSVEMEVVVPTKRSAKIDKQTHPLAEDVKVRVLTLPERLDSKGKPIQYTDAEKARLRGENPKLQGYAAELSALKVGQVVEIELGTRKLPPGVKKRADDPDTPVVFVIVIAKEAAKTIEKKK